MHHEMVEERFQHTKHEQKRREMQRKEGEQNFKEYLKLRQVSKPSYVVIRESYERDVVGARDAEQ